MKVLDKGFIELADRMGTDQSILKAARVSFANEDKRYTAEDDERLIDYLIRNQHTSPFEMAQLVFYVKAPIFVARQWMRHRTGSYNEWSGRYTELPQEFYEPEAWYKQGTAKQGRSEEVANMFGVDYKSICQSSFHVYNNYVKDEVAKEMARMVLPLSTYTVFYFGVDLHNLLRFLALRLHPHAQKEIRDYAKAILDIIEPLYPLTIKAWKKWVLNAVTLTKAEIEHLTGQQLLTDKRDIRILADKLNELRG